MVLASARASHESMVMHAFVMEMEVRDRQLSVTCVSHHFIVLCVNTVVSNCNFEGMLIADLQSVFLLDWARGVEEFKSEKAFRCG